MSKTRHALPLRKAGQSAGKTVLFMTRNPQRLHAEPRNIAGEDIV